MEFEKLSVEELKKGYTYSNNTYKCNVCNKSFLSGEIYTINNRMFDASKAIEMHILSEHEDMVKHLIYHESKYNQLTDNQKDLLFMIYSNLSDKDIAHKLGISPSTIRHQKFMFKEKAKQAKMYLAIYDLVMEKKVVDEDSIIPIHDNAVVFDDRFIITEKEKNHVLKTYFTSLEPLKLREFPLKAKRKIVVLNLVVERFEHGRRYTEKEVNQIIKDIYDDYVTIRRELIDYKYMDRTIDCNEYWLK